MKLINGIMLTLVIIAAINCGLVGLFRFNLVGYIFGNLSWFTRTMYVLAGIAGLWCISFYDRLGRVD